MCGFHEHTPRICFPFAARERSTTRSGRERRPTPDASHSVFLRDIQLGERDRRRRSTERKQKESKSNAPPPRRSPAPRAPPVLRAPPPLRAALAVLPESATLADRVARAATLLNSNDVHRYRLVRIAPVAASGRIIRYTYKIPAEDGFRLQMGADGRQRQVWLNNLPRMRSSIVRRLTQLEAIYRGRVRYQLTFTRSTTGCSPEDRLHAGDEEMLIPFASASATNTQASLSDWVTRALEQKEEEDDQMMHGSDTQTDFPTCELMTFRYHITIIPAAPAGGCFNDPSNPNVAPGNFTHTKTSAEGHRIHKNAFYWAEDSVIANFDNNCLLWCLATAIRRAHGGRMIDLQWMRQRMAAPPFNIPSQSAINLHDLEKVVVCFQEVTKIKLDVRVIKDTPEVTHRLDGVDICDYQIARADWTTYAEHLKDEGNGEYQREAFVVITYSPSKTPLLTSGHFCLLGGRYPKAPTPDDLRNHMDLQVKQEKKAPSSNPKAVKLPVDLHVTFDFETVFDHWGDLTTYAFTLTFRHPDEPKAHKTIYRDLLDTPDPSNSSALISHFFAILDDECQEAGRVVLVGQNCSKFDNYFLANYLAKVGVLYQHCVFIAGTSILSLKWLKYEVWDLYRFTHSSLKRAAEDFQCAKLKGHLDHVEVQAVYEKGIGEFLQFLRDHREQIQEYASTDTEVTMELFIKVTKALTDILGLRIPEESPETRMTLASLSEHIWKRSYLEKFPTVEHHIHAAQTYETQSMLRKAMYGGRAQAFRIGVFGPGDYEMMDVRSLYPHVMNDNVYPTGEEEPVSKMDLVSHPISCHRVIIHYQQQEVPNVIPRRSADETLPLDWTYKGSMTVYLMSPDILALQRFHGCGCCTVHEGVGWRHTQDIFSFYLKAIMTAKDTQDALKKKACPTYNPSVRAMAKLLANSLSGKVGQREFSSVVKLLFNKKSLEKELESQQLYTQTVFIPLGSRRVVMRANKTPQTMADTYKHQKAHPCHLSALIYSYSRNLMMEYITQCPSRIGMDTDSLFLEKKECTVFPTSDNVGDFTSEMAGLYKEHHLPYTPESRQRFIMVAPKCYMVVDHATNHVLKARFKGITSSARFIDPDFVKDMEPHLREQVINVFGTDGLRRYSNSERAHQVNAGYALLDRFPMALTERVFMRMLHNEPVFVVQSQIVKNLFDVREQQMAILRQKFVSKSLKIHRRDTESSASPSGGHRQAGEGRPEQIESEEHEEQEDWVPEEEPEYAYASE